MKHVIKVERDVEIIKIALTGKLRSGKDTAAHHLYIRQGFDRFAFGDALKRTVREVFPWQYELTGGKPRALYQQYGQLMRQIDEDVWIKHVESRVKGAIDYHVNCGKERVGIVITDVRQPNEYDWCRDNGFTIIRVTAPIEQRLARAQAAGDDFDEDDLTHDTESHVDSFDVDYEIVNDGSLTDLCESVDEVMANINEKGAVE